MDFQKDFLSFGLDFNWAKSWPCFLAFASFISWSLHVKCFYYICGVQEVVSLGEEAHLNTSFKHFVYFIQAKLGLAWLALPPLVASDADPYELLYGNSLYGSGSKENHSNFNFFLQNSSFPKKYFFYLLIPNERKRRK